MALMHYPSRKNSPPLQGEGWVGMGLIALCNTNPIPIPAFPLKGKEQMPFFI